MKKQLDNGKRVQAFLHSGNLGDVIWSLPFIISQSGGDIYLRNHNMFSATNRNHQSLFRLLSTQAYIRKVNEYPIEYGKKNLIMEGPDIGRINMEKKVKYHPDIELDYDLDYFRLSPHLNKEHLISSYFTVNNIPPMTLPLPFINLKEDYDFKNKHLNKKVPVPVGEYNCFQISQRYRCEYDWGKLIKEQKNKNYFIGLKEEYDEIVKDYNVKDDLIFYGDQISDMYDMAIMIKNSDKFYCNPSVGMTLAVALNKEYCLVKDPSQGGVQTNLPMETIINI
tara:strand:- start:415 stop:1254 length:840 start_codon:yes stop_codon:yes gene_type:complete